MSEVQRYDWSMYDGMIPYSDGDWVSFEDFRRIEAERDRLHEALFAIDPIVTRFLTKETGDE